MSLARPARLIRTAPVTLRETTYYFAVDFEKDAACQYRVKSLEPVGDNGDTVVITDDGFTDLTDAVHVMGDAYKRIREKAKKMRAAQRGQL